MPQLHQKFLKGGCAGIVLISVMAILFCSKDYNPFNDLTNAKVHVTSWSFTNRDSVAIYETGAFKVVVALREEVDSFSFHAPKNRFWTDTVVRASGGKIIEGGPYTFSVSFFDTGRDTVKLHTFRSNGEMIPQEFQVRVYNPLHQEPVRGYFGDTTILSTVTVPDKGVLFHWSMGGGWRTSSDSNRVSVVLPLFNQTNKPEGRLWVSDLAGNNASPKVAFTYSFDDTSKPVIQCKNDGLHGDSIISGDTVFAFKALISDGGDADVESCSVNQTGFDYAIRGNHEYTKLFKNLPALTANNTPLTLAVYALDNQQFQNVSRDTFRVFFSPGGIKSAHYSVAFNFPKEDTAISLKRSYLINCVAQNDHGDSMKLAIRVNDKNNLFTKTIADKYELNWLAPLDTIINNVVVSAYSLDNRLLASAQRVIIFNPNAVDTINPIIWEVSTDGVLLGSVFYTENRFLILKIVAFDDRSGIATMIANQDTLPFDSISYGVWEWRTGDLAHTDQGTSVRILAIDNSGNEQERDIKIYKNSIPYLVKDLDIPAQCCMDSMYTSLLSWKDADNDVVGLKYILLPKGMNISPEGNISWKPVLRPDTARDTLIIELQDRYQSKPYQWIFTSIPCNQSKISMAFATRDQDFPAVLQAERDQLHVFLSIDSSGGSFTARYSARFIDNGSSLLDNDTSGEITWRPSLADTGFRKLMVTVGNGLRGFDTLFPSFWVVPKNQYPCSLSVAFSGTVTPTGGLDLFSHPDAETLFFSIHDQDHPRTESYQVTVSLGALRSVGTFNQKDFFIAIAPKSSKIADTLTVSVLDKTGKTDSMRFIIQYFFSNDNTPPRLADTGAPKFPVYFCGDSLYTDFQIISYDPNNDTVDVVKVYAPTGMTVSKRGQVEWLTSRARLGEDSLSIRFFDQRDSSGIYSWPLTVIDCANKPPAVLFQTRGDAFPAWLQAEVDSISLQLQTVSGSGVRPFAFEGRTDNGVKVVSDSIGKLLYRPRNSDTGARTIKISVKDHYNTGDSLSSQIYIVPRNRQLCSLTYTYSGTTLPSGFLYMPVSDMYPPAQPESALFVIHDADNPLTEQYVVQITQRSAQPTSLNLAGANRSFSVKINSNSGTGGPGGPTPQSKDTVIVSVKDKTGTSDTVKLVIQYSIRSLSDIPQLNLNLNSSTGVSTQGWRGGSQVNRWSPDGSIYYNSFSQNDPDRQPTLVDNLVNGKPAIYFDHVTDNGDDGLFNDSYTQWADTPFTLMVVFSANSMPANNRQTLISTNTPDGFGLGIACNGKLGIFNDKPANTCPTNDSAGTNLTVTNKTWYVASFESSLGITVGGTIRVQAWLNGVAASQQMEMRTQSDAGLMVGTGSTNYSGSFDGYIAAIVIYQRALSNDERSLVERYLGSQYKITVK